MTVPPAMLAYAEQAGMLAGAGAFDAFELVNATVRSLEASEWAYLPGKGQDGADLVQLRSVAFSATGSGVARMFVFAPSPAFRQGAQASLAADNSKWGPLS